MFFRKKSPEATNNSEQAPDSNSSNTEYPAFDPEAAKRRIAEYKAAHPKAVDDIDKAYEMAKAEDPYRTEAADYRKGAKINWDKVHKYRRMQMETLNATDVDRESREWYYRSKADQIKEKALDYEREARINDAKAESIGQAAGERYDLDRLSPEAKEELKQKRIVEYKAAHPNAVDDVEKAYKMAKAEDPFRTEAANLRNFAKQAWERREKQLAMDYEADAMENDDIAEARGEFVGKKYDSERAKAMSQTETKTQANADTATPGQTYL